MKNYVIASGLVFALVFCIHIARLAFEGMQVLKDPFFVISTALALGFCVWALRLLRK